jgi:cysteine-rich repeat protein
VIDDPSGGYIEVKSGSTVTVTGTVKARDVASFGGEILLEGCAVDVQTGADVSTIVTRLTSHEQMTIAGHIASDASTTLRYRAGGPLPIVVGIVSPPPSLVAAVLTACSAAAVCGNGTLEPPEECDHGAANGTSGDSCDAVCKELPPALRIPGGGSRTTDCALEWTATLGQTVVDGSGLPRTFQGCTDNDPACDADPTAGTCSFHVWACLGGDDARLACPAAGVSSVEVRGPTGVRGAPARVALVGALQALTFPVGPGEQCSGRADVDVPVKKSVKLRTRTHLAGGNKKDSDGLVLKCLAP